MTIYLYAKQHNKTGLRYFGKTTRDPYQYNGSGKYWISHCNKHDWDITTTWVHAYEDIALCEQEALFFSEVYDIVESSDWANLKPENGCDGGSVKGRILGPQSVEHSSKISNALKGKTRVKGYKRPEHSEKMKIIMADWGKGRVPHNKRAVQTPLGIFNSVGEGRKVIPNLSRYLKRSENGYSYIKKEQD